jgi:formamidopyrimidine-DNA glycosylase
VLRRRLRGRRFDGLERLGKYLVATLDDGQRLLLHLGMTGQLLVSAPAPAAGRPDRHTHLRLGFDDHGPDVLFRDVRKFGKVQLLARGEACRRLDRLGVDALAATVDDLLCRARSRRTPIKSLLLDQSVIAGVGNIYADEALFLAGLRPSRRASRLTRQQAERLVESLEAVLRQALELGGSSFSDYIHPDGDAGSYQEEHRVYGRRGEPCSACGTPIRRTRIAQRSSHFCPSCQR